MTLSWKTPEFHWIQQQFSDLPLAQTNAGSGIGGVVVLTVTPHPGKVTDKGAVNSVRRFLENAGVKYDGV